VQVIAASQLEVERLQPGHVGILGFQVHNADLDVDARLGGQAGH
jgi:hypothetical protein